MLKVKQGDLRPYVVMWLEQPLGVPIPNLADASVITFKMRRADAVVTSGPSVTGPCELLDPGEAKVRYKWQVGETDSKGTFNIEVQYVVDGEPQTVPTEGFQQIEIVDDLDADV